MSSGTQFESKSPAKRHSMLLGIVFASLILGVGAMGLAKAQSPDATSPPATPDSRPLQIDRGAQGAQNLKCAGWLHREELLRFPFGKDTRD